MDFTILLLKPIPPPFTVCPGPHPLLRSGVRPQNLNLMCYAQLIPRAAGNPGSGGRDGSSSSSSPACRVLLEPSENSLQPSCSTAQSRRGMHSSFLPHPASSSLVAWMRSNRAQSSTSGLGNGVGGGGWGGYRMLLLFLRRVTGHRLLQRLRCSLPSTENLDPSYL